MITTFAGLERATQLAGDRIEFGPWSLPDGTSAISSEARSDMEMTVWYLLARGGTIGQTETDALATYGRAIERRRNPLSKPEHPSASWLGQIGKRGVMLPGHHKGVARISRMDVQQRNDEVVLVDEAR